jgi:hypothetical protein
MIGVMEPPLSSIQSSKSAKNRVSNSPNHLSYPPGILRSGGGAMNFQEVRDAPLSSRTIPHAVG